MPRTNKDIISLLRIVLTDHKSHWEAQMGELKRYKNAYENRFWEGESTSDQMIRVETADCFSYVEGFIAALFSKAPAVVVWRRHRRRHRCRRKSKNWHNMTRHQCWRHRGPDRSPLCHIWETHHSRSQARGGHQDHVLLVADALQFCCDHRELRRCRVP